MAWQDYKDTVQKLYIAFYQRPGDPGGVRFWAELLDQQNGSLEGIIDPFATSAEAIALYDTNGDGSLDGNDDMGQLVDSIYQALFNRAPDAAGKQFYLDALTNGEFPDGRPATPGRVALDILNGAQGSDLVTIANKVASADTFTDALDLDGGYLPPYQATYAGEEDAQKARDWLATVTSDSATVKKSDEAIDFIAQNIADAGDPIFQVPNLHEEALQKSHTIGSVDSSSMLTADSPIVQALYSGHRWYQDIVTYSFNDQIPPEYSGDNTNGWRPLSTQMKERVDTVMEDIRGLIETPLLPVEDYGDIRFNVITTPLGVNGYTYLPTGADSTDGDVFLSDLIGVNEDNGLEPGDQGYMTIIHEVGHALGLKHPFEEYPTLPQDLDNTVNTLMSYTDLHEVVVEFVYSGDDTSYQVSLEGHFCFPQSFMVFDIAALQAIYGPNTTTHDEDSVYKILNSSNGESSNEGIYTLQLPFYYTIWDGGGVDTLDFSDTTYPNRIDLRPGSYSDVNYEDVQTQIDNAQRKFEELYGKNEEVEQWIANELYSMEADLYTGEKALGIAYGVVIENAIGGSGDDVFIDNGVDNYLAGNGGDDIFILGEGGYDEIDGGEGYDAIVLNIAKSEASLQYFGGGDGLLVADDFAVQFHGVEEIAFEDHIFSLV